MVVTHVPYAYCVGALLQKNMLSHILCRPAATALPGTPGEAISRFRGDCDTLRWFGMDVSGILGGVISTGIAIVVMLSINVEITLFAFIPVLSISLIANSATNKIDRLHRASREAAGNVTGFIGEIFGAAEILKSVNAERDVVRRFRDLNDRRAKSTLRDDIFHHSLGSIYHARLLILVLVLYSFCQAQRSEPVHLR